MPECCDSPHKLVRLLRWQIPQSVASSFLQAMPQLLSAACLAAQVVLQLSYGQMLESGGRLGIGWYLWVREQCLCLHAHAALCTWHWEWWRPSSRCAPASCVSEVPHRRQQGA